MIICGIIDINFGFMKMERNFNTLLTRQTPNVCRVLHVEMSIFFLVNKTNLSA